MSRPPVPLVYDNERYAMARGFGVNEFGKLLEGALGRESKEGRKKRFSPSGMGYAGQCPRKWYYAFNGAFFDYSNTKPADMANMNQGSAAGERIAAVLERTGILVESEKLVDTTSDPTMPPILGYIDAVVNWKGQEVICEVKTTRDATWNYRTTNNMVPGYQLMQLLLYMYIEKKDRGFFLTENKDNNRIFILPVRMTPEYSTIVENMLDWMRTVWDNAKLDFESEGQEHLPNRVFEKASMECRGCEFKSICWDGFDKGTKLRKAADPNPGVVDLPKLEIPK